MLAPDVDECASQSCPANSVCVNTEGSYNCQCFNGYEKIGSLCYGKLEDVCTSHIPVDLIFQYNFGQLP